ncbi:hypothetical protein Q7P37_009471 [Cladosporium fusiforme]
MAFTTVLAWVFGSPIAIFFTTQILYVVAQVTKIPQIDYYARCVASFTALLICATYGTIASACLNVVGYGGLGQWTTARSFKWTMLLFTGVWFEIEDPDGLLQGETWDRLRPAVLLGNHQTELDVLFLGHLFPKYTSVTAKKSLMYTPFLGWFMALSKTVFIERKSRSQAVAAFDKAAEQMHKNRQSVYIFPEGTRSYYDQPDLLPFKKGAFHLAVQAQVPILPIVVANYSNVLDVKRKLFRPGTIPVRVVAPIQTKGKTKEDVDALVEQTRNVMLSELKAITVKARDSGVALKEGEKVNGTAKSSGVDLDVAGGKEL